MWLFESSCRLDITVEGRVLGATVNMIKRGRKKITHVGPDFNNVASRKLNVKWREKPVARYNCENHHNEMELG